LTISSSGGGKPRQIRGGLGPQGGEQQNRRIAPRVRHFKPGIQEADLRKAPDVVIRGLNLGIKPQGHPGDL
jgi:hypothetical protein